jgi:hypothetical protein
LQPTSLVIHWNSYTGSSAILLSLVLFLIAAGFVLLARRMKGNVKLPKMGKITLAVVVVVWAFFILTFLKINKDIAKHTGAAANLGPIFPITIITAVCTFAYVAYVCRSGGPLSALGNGFLAFCAGPMVFELPFLFVVIPQAKAPLVLELIFLTPLFIIIFTTLSLLLYSRRISITRNSVYLFAAMIFVFALWALDGFSYPSNPISFALNGISKVLGFASVAALFASKPREVSPAKGEQMNSEKVSKAQA